MSANDLILARQAVRSAITRLRKAQVGASVDVRQVIELRIEALTETVHGLTRDLYAVQHPQEVAT
jgi:hypothetical protein